MVRSIVTGVVALLVGLVIGAAVASAPRGKRLVDLTAENARLAKACQDLQKEAAEVAGRFG